MWLCCCFLSVVLCCAQRRIYWLCLYLCVFIYHRRLLNCFVHDTRNFNRKLLLFPQTFEQHKFEEWEERKIQWVCYAACWLFSWINFFSLCYTRNRGMLPISQSNEEGHRIEAKINNNNNNNTDGTSTNCRMPKMPQRKSTCKVEQKFTCSPKINQKVIASAVLTYRSTLLLAAATIYNKFRPFSAQPITRSTFN